MEYISVQDKLVVLVDMDDTIFDYQSHIASHRSKANPYPQSNMDFFRSLPPLSGAIEGVKYLDTLTDLWFLTRPSYKNPLCYTEKRLQIEDHFGLEMCKKLILAPDKGMVKGDYLIDDHRWEEFEGTQLVFRSLACPDWDHVIRYFDNLIQYQRGYTI